MLARLIANVVQQVKLVLVEIKPSPTFFERAHNKFKVLGWSLAKAGNRFLFIPVVL